LVVVDDIDRHADELQSVVKAVRLLGRFDEKTVLDVLESSDIAKSDQTCARLRSQA
jgi:hypothetical protein